MKILFLTPPAKDIPWPTLGIASITSLLNQKGHEAVIREGNNRTFEELVDFVKKVNPDVVGITMDTTTRFLGLELAKRIKKRYGLPIILGGIHATLMTDQILRNYKFIDYIVKYEGEISCLNLINALEKGKDVRKVKGISYRKGDKIIHNERELPIQDLDSLPYPEYKFFDLKSYSKNPEHPKELLKYPSGSIISSRGCPYRCSFCSTSDFWGHTIRFRKPKFIVEEMEKLYFQYNIRHITFNDDNFTVDKKRVIETCKLIIKKGLHKKIKWVCSSEVNSADKEMFKWMKRAGCYIIEYGIEDMSEEGLKFFNKAHTIKQAFDAFKLTHEAGIGPGSFLIIGGDHETPENIINKKRMLEKLNPITTTAALLLVYPRTQIYEHGKKEGWWDDSIWLEPCVGKKFHKNVPIYPSKNMSFPELFAAAADIMYGWNKKKGNFSYKFALNHAFSLLKKRDISKMYHMSRSVILRKLRGEKL
jgi:radical SAM superfamily enzyme YgiQ (UPF0313 family)